LKSAVQKAVDERDAARTLVTDVQSQLAATQHQLKQASVMQQQVSTTTAVNGDAHAYEKVSINVFSYAFIFLLPLLQKVTEATAHAQSAQREVADLRTQLEKKTSALSGVNERLDAQTRDVLRMEAELSAAKTNVEFKQEQLAKR
jgi:DNA repair exonuclease SbcCD ATPase subunit